MTESKQHGEHVDVPRSDGKTVPCHAVRRADAKVGVVVIQEWWGLNPQIKKTGERMAAEGFDVLVPDLYRGKVAQNAREAGHMMQGLDWDGALQDIDAAVRALKQGHAKVAVMGFCMGGALTLFAAAKLADVGGAVCFYGIPDDKLCDPARITCPVQLHFATHDDWCTPARVDALDRKLRAPHEVFRYDAQHAFMNEARPEVYAPESAAQAWQRTVAFLRAL